jgi:hypothetical protein
MMHALNIQDARQTMWRGHAQPEYWHSYLFKVLLCIILQQLRLSLLDLDLGLLILDSAPDGLSVTTLRLDLWTPAARPAHMCHSAAVMGALLVERDHHQLLHCLAPTCTSSLSVS